MCYNVSESPYAEGMMFWKGDNLRSRHAIGLSKKCRHSCLPVDTMELLAPYKITIEFQEKKRRTNHGKD